MAKRQPGSRGSCSVYLDIEKKQLVEVTGPIFGKNLSQVLDDALTSYLNQYAPLDLLDLEIRRLEEQLASLKAERSRISASTRLTEVLQATAQQQAHEARQQKESLDSFRDDKFRNDENIRSLSYQVKHKTIDWNIIKTRYNYDNAIEAREDVLTRLLALGKISDKECTGV